MHKISRQMLPPLIVVSVLLAPSPAGAQDEVVYFHTDAIGSVRAVTDANGAVIARYDYLPFGELWPTVPPQPAEVRQFAGKERDSATGLDYFGARCYAAQTARFTTVDPVLNVDAALLDPQRWNRYAYAANRPLTMIDPDGRDPRLVGAGIGAAVFGTWQAYQNVRQGRPWYENVGVQASQGLIIGATLGLAAPAIAGTTATQMGVLTSTAGGGAAANALGVAREAYVAQLVGGRVAGDVRITLHGVGSTAIDVYGKAGEFIGVGGPAKAGDLAALGRQLQVLAGAAKQAGTTAHYYFAKGTPQAAITLAQKWLGKENVFVFDMPK